MKALRRSFKSEKDQQAKPPHLSLQSKSAVAIVPPKKVIKALYDYEPQNRDGQELAFHKGDFFHVLSREDDTEWYEACNPLIPTARGLVPVAFFEVIGKQQRQSGQSISSERGDNDSGFSQGTTPSSHTRSESSATARPLGHQRGMSSTSRSIGATVYGTMLYDFHAERPDELSAAAGEAIIVVAQSNPEWFVAKPISRLGGPGLVPVAFVDIKDSTSLQSVADPLEAAKRAGVLTVEEWKKNAAEYKNKSIPLGKFDNAQGQMTQGMGNMSIGRQGQPQQQRGQYPQSMHQHQSPQQQVPLAPVEATVVTYTHDKGTFWYVMDCKMEDGSCWTLLRYYADFYDLQISLLEAFPMEAGNLGPERTLPYMPGPVAHVTDNIAKGRKENLDAYIKKIVTMPPHISKSLLVRNLFKPRPGDDEIEPQMYGQIDYRQSFDSQRDLQRMQSNPASRQTSNTYAPNSAYGGVMSPKGPGSYPRQQTPVSAGTGMHAANGGPYLHNQASSLTQNSTSSSMKANPGGAMKIKVYFQQETIVIRVPQDISFGALRDKLVERLKVNEDIAVQYKDDPSNAYIDMRNDSDLDSFLQSNQGKLALYVNYAAG